MTALNVKDYGARGDGVSDDAPAIQSALDAVGSGGVVYLPPGKYVIGGTLRPSSRTLIYGSHVPHWEDGSTAGSPVSACKIQARAGFADTALITAASTSAVMLRNLALVGAGVGSGVTGVAAEGANSWCLEDVSIAGCSGDGLAGEMHVASLRRCFVSANRGWGVNASRGWFDCHLSDCYFFYNRAGNVLFGGGTSEPSGYNSFVNCRFERAGTDPEDVRHPLNSGAPGVHIENARNMLFANCETDANCGNGIEIVASAQQFVPSGLLMSNCRLSRDGTGSGATLPQSAAIKVQGRPDNPVSHVKLHNCAITYGLADDAGGGHIYGPRYGLWYENTSYLEWIGGQISLYPGNPPHSEFFAGRTGSASNLDAQIISPPNVGLLTLPLHRPGDGVPVPTGSVYYDSTRRTLNVFSGKDWRGLKLG